MGEVRAVVLGAAQDAGVPQLGCPCARCTAARSDPARVRRAAALGLVAADGRAFLLDATPDIRFQAPLLPRLDGLLLTHGHIGHYAGLIHLGREAMAARRLPVWGTARMLSFLRANAPWELLVRLGNVELHEAVPGAPIRLAHGLTVEPVAVTHRAEYTDTVGYLVRGPAASLLYVPDVDVWDFDLRGLVGAVDAALLDGTFFSPEELPPARWREVGHPPIAATLDLLAAGGLAGRVRFTHLNHTNPAWDPTSAAAHRIADAGAAVAREGEILPL
jgi:pyrroloquinoline quinone biosynthesis protein B